MFSSLFVTGYDVTMTVVQGRGLAAKDRHFLTRRRTTSDPFVVVFLGIDQRLGQSKTCDKTLDPVWNSTFTFNLSHKKKHKAVCSASDDAMGETMEACGTVFIKIYDEDKYTDPDLMGTIVIPIPAAPRSKTKESTFVTKQWYKVDDLFVPHATGEIEVEFTVVPLMASKSVAADWLPSPQTVARLTSACLGKSKPEVDENNVVVENSTAQRSYIMALVKEMYANRGVEQKSGQKGEDLFQVPLETRLNEETSSLLVWLRNADKIVGHGGFSKLL